MLLTLRDIHSKHPATARGDVAGVLYVTVALGGIIAAAVNIALIFS